ncbi:MAG: BlaI/MecI/CopY family transcriptional regulator [Armatimonadota bacterium]
MPKRVRRDRITQLGELQLQVLDVLCRLGEGTVYDVLGEFPEPERPRYTTVLTVLRSLEKRGLAEHRTTERQYIFRPTSSSSEVRRGLLQEVLDRVFDGSPRDMVATLLDVDRVTPEEVQELKELIAKWEVEGDDS